MSEYEMKSEVPGVIRELTAFGRDCYHTTVQKGFYDDPDMLLELVADGCAARHMDPEEPIKYLRHVLEMASFMRMVTEISEAAEAARQGNPPAEKIDGFNHVEEELADLLIRVSEWSYGRGHQIAEAAVAKAEYNRSRPRKHGKVS